MRAIATSAYAQQTSAAAAVWASEVHTTAASTPAQAAAPRWAYTMIAGATQDAQPDPGRDRRRVAGAAEQAEEQQERHRPADRHEPLDAQQPTHAPIVGEDPHPARRFARPIRRSPSG